MKKPTAILTIVKNGYDLDEAYYLDDALYTTVHCNDRHYIPDILKDVFTSFDVTKEVTVEIDYDIVDIIVDELNYQFPDRLTALQTLIQQTQTTNEKA